MKYLYLYLILSLVGYTTLAQRMSISGEYTGCGLAAVELIGYDALSSTTLSTDTSTASGIFEVSYPKEYVGAAMLRVAGAPDIILMLNHEQFTIALSDVYDLSTLSFGHSVENEAFISGMLIYQDATAKLAALRYLLPLYEQDQAVSSFISQEISKQSTRFALFSERLSPDNYVSSYLQWRHFLSDMSPMVKSAGGLQKLQAKWSALDFSELRFRTSGLYPQMLEQYSMNLVGSLPQGNIDSVFAIGAGIVVSSLSSDVALQQLTAEYWFNFLEKRSLYGAAKQVALQMLDQENCQLEDKYIHLFEQYRRMAIGRTAPDITIHNGTSLSALGTPYQLVVFGASWCPMCTEEYPKLTSAYRSLKEKYDIEVVYVSLDEEKEAFQAFYADAPFAMVYDGKGWQTQSAVDYHVYATPSMFLLDQERTILLKPKSVDHVSAWLRVNTK